MPTTRGSSRWPRRTPGGSFGSGRPRPPTCGSSRSSTGDRGSRFRLKAPSGEAAIALPLPGAHQVANFLAASAVALAAGASVENCAEAAGKLAPAAHRGESRRHASGALLYDDAYNASPPSMRAALDTLKLLPGKRKIAVLGDMRELGPESEWWHRETGRYVLGRADRLICVGPLGRFLADGAIEAGFPRLGSPDPRHAGACRQPAQLHAGRGRHRPLQGFAGRRARARGRPARPPSHGGRQVTPTPERQREADAVLLALPARQALPALQRLSVHHVPDGDGGGHGAAAPARARPVDDPDVEAPPDRPVDPGGRAAVAPGQGGHSHDGRPPDPAGDHRGHASVDGPLEPLRVDRARHAARPGRRRLRRRLHEGGAQAQPRADRTGQAAAAVPRRLRRGMGDRAVGDARRLLDRPDLPVPEEVPARSRSAVRSFRGGRCSWAPRTP